MARLLVSVRSAAEAAAAVEGGARIIDVKEPDRGPLGRANPAVWRAVRDVVPFEVPVSVALGELIEAEVGPSPAACDGIAWRKLGLAGAGRDWLPRWAAYRRAVGSGPGWIAVAYLDWRAAAAPSPDAVLTAALATGCVGLLLDTWSKACPGTLDESWFGWISEARAANLMVALAGGLDVTSIRHLASLRPDIFAVRGAACFAGDRRAGIDPKRVAALAAACGS